jgi:four helix bundle protein
MANYKQLVLWKKASDLTALVCSICEGFPPHDFFGIAGRLRKAALSVPVLIAEGCQAESKSECARYLELARGKLFETEYLTGLALRLGYLRGGSRAFAELAAAVGRLLIKYQRRLATAAKRSDRCRTN